VPVNTRVNLNIYIVTMMTVVLGVIFYSGFREASWLVMLIFALLQIYLADVKVRISERTDVSLGAAAVLPMVIMCGVTQSMLISVLLGIYDGVKGKKEWQRSMFNAAQLALSALMMRLSFVYVRDALAGTGFELAVAAIVATAVYIVFNIGLVCRMAAISRGVSWLAHFRLVFPLLMYSSFSSGFIGIIFAFFILSYEFWGLVAFSVLLISLSGLLEAAAAVSVEREQRKQLEEELVIDEMTGAYNFRYLNNWLGEPSGEAMSLLFMDIDDFALFNDTYGHAEGDKVLALLVETIRKSVREDDHVIRYGGDEFVVLLRGVDAEGARRLAGRIVKNLTLVTTPTWKEPITVSLGIAVKPEHTKDKRQLLLYADQAMYKAKEAGKNNAQVWSEVQDIA